MRVVDTSAWLEWLGDSALGREVGLELPETVSGIVPTIVQYELSRYLTREVSEEVADETIAFSTQLRRCAFEHLACVAGGGHCPGERAGDGRRHRLRHSDRLRRGPANLRRALRRIAAGRLFPQGVAMSEPARPFFIPMIGIVALFAALGPAVGGALFIPLSVVFKPTITPDTIALLVLIAALVRPRHWIGCGLCRGRRPCGGDRVSLCAVGRCRHPRAGRARSSPE